MVMVPNWWTAITRPLMGTCHGLGAAGIASRTGATTARSARRWTRESEIT